MLPVELLDLFQAIIELVEFVRPRQGLDIHLTQAVKHQRQRPM